MLHRLFSSFAILGILSGAGFAGSLTSLAGAPLTSGGAEVTPPPVTTVEDQEPFFPFTLAATFLWESRYITEGRNNLEEGGLVSALGAFEYEGLAASVWWAAGDSSSYTELNLVIEYSRELFAGLEAYVGYNHLRFPDDNEFDNEIGAGLAWGAFPFLVPAVDWYHSFEADGSFLELRLSSEIPVIPDLLTLSPYGLLAFNFGYVADESEGVNNLQVGLDAELRLHDHFAFIGYIAHTWGLDEDPGDTLVDEFWGGAGITISF